MLPNLDENRHGCETVTGQVTLYDECQYEAGYRTTHFESSIDD